jgi:voltage-gated potassium channel
MGQTRPLAPVRRAKGNSIYLLFIIALTLFSLLLVATYYLLPLSAATKEMLLWIDVPISLIFLADALGSLRRAPHKRSYLKWGWLDFVGSIPLILPLRLARLWRLIRAWRTLQLRRLRDVGQDLDRNRAESAALITVLLAIVALTAATVAVLEFESEVPQANIRSGGDALWWALVTLATVGYGDNYPVTIPGRVAAVVLMTVGVGVFGMLASYLANLFLPTAPGDDRAGELVEVKAELERLNQQLDTLQAMLGDRNPAPPGDAEVEPSGLEAPGSQVRLSCSGRGGQED